MPSVAEIILRSKYDDSGIKAALAQLRAVEGNVKRAQSVLNGFASAKQPVFKPEVDDSAVRELTAVIGRLNSALPQMSRGLSDEEREAKRAADAIRQATREHNALVNEQIKGRASAGDFAGAQAIIQRELDDTNTSLVRQQQLLNRQGQLLRQASRAQENGGPVPYVEGGNPEEQNL